MTRNMIINQIQIARKMVVREKKGAATPKYLAAKTDVDTLFQIRLQQLVQNDKFAAWRYNYTHYKDKQDDVFHETLVILGSFDGYRADGHFISKKRSLHCLKFGGWQPGVAGSPKFLLRGFVLFIS